MRPVVIAVMFLMASCGDSTREHAPQAVKWDYTTMAGSPDPGALAQHLKDMGAECWELVGNYEDKPPYEHVYVFKRPAVDSSTLKLDCAPAARRSP